MTGGAPPLPPDDLLHMERLGRFRRLPNLWPHGDVRRPATVSTWLPAGGWLHCTQGTWPSSGIRTGTLIQILDMTKDIIVCGGENISSIEVESVISGHRAVLEVAAVARPDDNWGETPCAFVKLKSDAAANVRIVTSKFFSSVTK